MDDDWGLQAVVRGCRTTTKASEPDPFTFFSHTHLQEEEEKENHLLCFPNLETCMQELEDFCKPFYLKTPEPISPQSLSMVSISPISPLKGKQQQQKPTQPQISRSKRRKNQQKRVVCEVPVEGLSSDMWAWRKYGQKPIKGSPYPRGYYRCSSSKGCLARKQVERNRSNPSMFVITYTAEHNHPPPTHRNSLAGSTRLKHSSEKASKESSSSGLSPTTPLMASIDEEIFLQQKKEDEEGEDMTQMSDDMFLDLEELQEPTSTSGSFDDCFSDHFSSPGR